MFTYVHATIDLLDSNRLGLGLTIPSDTPHGTRRKKGQISRPIGFSGFSFHDARRDRFVMVIGDHGIKVCARSLVSGVGRQDGGIDRKRTTTRTTSKCIRF